MKGAHCWQLPGAEPPSYLTAYLDPGGAAQGDPRQLVRGDSGWLDSLPEGLRPARVDRAWHHTAGRPRVSFSPGVQMAAWALC